MKGGYFAFTLGILWWFKIPQFKLVLLVTLELCIFKEIKCTYKHETEVGVQKGYCYEVKTVKLLRWR